MDFSELQQIKERELASGKTFVLRCCMAAGCLSIHSQQIKLELESAVRLAGMEGSVEVRCVGCLKLCSQGPLVQADPSGALYEKVRPEDAAAIVASLNDSKAGPAQIDTSHPFFTGQQPIVLANSGVVDPERIESYVAADGYRALHDALFESTPKNVIQTMVESGLRGRGGAGYPTGLKWGTVAKSPGGQKYVICNADEGDPGAFMDRSILEGDPHSVLEGMAIAGYAVGATQGYIYLRAEYPLANSRLHLAIKQAKRLGLLGSRVLDSPFSFSIEIRTGGGAYVCGEETALMASVQGERGMPHPRPPYPAERGLWGCPTLINNVETLANVPVILRKGSAWFSSFGTAKSKGTKVLALAGKIRNTGLVEVPMGTTLRKIVEDMGGGTPDGSQIKAVQTGGPSGGCIPAELLDTPVDYESLIELGSIMGSGGMIVMDDTTNMVDVARYFTEFCMDESCGKCIPCRVGTVQMYRLLNKIIQHRAVPRDLEKLEELCDMVKHTSLCGLGQAAPNPVLSTLRYFRKEFTDLLQPDGSGLASAP